MGDDARRLVLMGLLTLWVVAWGLSVFAFVTGEPGAAGAAGGSPRMMAALGWQMAALIPAFAAWAVARRWPSDSEVRAVARVPLQLSLGVVAVVGALVLWAVLAG